MSWMTGNMIFHTMECPKSRETRVPCRPLRGESSDGISDMQWPDMSFHLDQWRFRQHQNALARIAAEHRDQASDHRAAHHVPLATKLPRWQNSTNSAGT